LTSSAAEPIVVCMKTWVALAAVFLTVASIGSQAVSACGDKFLLVGRGVRFQRAYAAIHPASILIVVPPKSVKNAAVRDSRLQTALKMAGHRVEIVAPANLAEILGRSRYDIILAERADALAIPDVLPAGPSKPMVIGVLEDPSSAALTAAHLQFDGVLKAPQPLSEILKLLDDAMMARIDNGRRQAASGA
jgi:hypothetical protein